MLQFKVIDDWALHKRNNAMFACREFDVAWDRVIKQFIRAVLVQFNSILYRKQRVHFSRSRCEPAVKTYHIEPNI